MKRSSPLRRCARAALVLPLALAAACLPGVVAAVHFPAPPLLVAVAPGIWVVEDAPRAVFYVGHHYWYEERGLWYRAPSYQGHWVRVAHHAVPTHIRAVDSRRYRYVRAAPGTRVWRAGDPRVLDTRARGQARGREARSGGRRGAR